MKAEGGGVCVSEGGEQRPVDDQQQQPDQTDPEPEPEPEPEPKPAPRLLPRAMFQDDEHDEEEDDEDDDEEDDSGTDGLSNDEKLCTHLQRAEAFGSAGLPHIFQTNHLLFYERFKAYQDYMLGDCKPSEVQEFTADYLEKVVEPCDWQALWHTDMVDVLVEVVDVDYKELKGKVELVEPLQCEYRGCDLTEDSVKTLLEAKQNKVPLQELHVVYDESGEFDQTALALEHLRFFYKHIWRPWDEDEDDEFDYFVRCVEPRLRMYYDILEERVAPGLVEEYRSVLDRCSQKFREFSSLRNVLSSEPDSELNNVSMVEGLRMCEQMEALKRKLLIIENPLLRYVLGHRMNCGQQSCSAKGERAGGGRVVHVVSSSSTVQLLHGLMTEKLLPLYSGREYEVQFHSDPSVAVSSCYEGDVVIICPGHYTITNPISIADSIQVEGYGLPDEIVIEKKNKGNTFVESSAASAKISNLKFIQHDAIEGIMCVRQGKVEMENCVFQCETAGVIVRSSAQLIMNMCDLYGSQGAGVEIYPGSVCSLVGNGIHHCKEGILIKVMKDIADAMDVLPQITMVNNVIHNNEGYGVILVKPDTCSAEPAASQTTEGELEDQSEGGAAEGEGVAGAARAGSGCAIPVIVVEESASPSGITDGGDVMVQGGMVNASVTTRRLVKSRAKDLGTTQADENLLSQDMFVSIEGNQFRRNGMGSFGTLLY
ncbi:SHC SH2 domain-binding protein 1 [Astyanax mexicanus]|uniref:SHC SH2 domain-binding protein 1 n=1 Tax=Astyanax mexicanus TaxID=7994 RepID=A0A8T2KU34_ASTMX|nr:SHC SH2 domain-binding protein 1 [Astyanax mexicanus]